MTLPPFHANPLFNAHHSPMGAYLSFTCGHPNTKGGLAAQLGKPAGQDLFIGIKPGPRNAPGPLKVLPFFDGADQATPQSNFTPETASTTPTATGLLAYPKDHITRRYGHATDEFQTPDFTFRIFTPFGPIPDPSLNPAAASPEEIRNALLPAITAELEIDNSTSPHPVTAFFAINFHDGGCRILEHLAPHQRGFAFRADLGFAAEVAPDFHAPLHPLLRWSVEEALTDTNPVHLLGQCPGIALEIPAGRRATIRLALGCHLAHPVTTRLEARYLYTRHYQNLQDVLTIALARFDDLKAQSQKLDQQLLASNLSPDQQFLIAHATRSYYANTQLLDLAGQPYWIVNEGEYCMMNTLDLAADQVFWELEQNPWVVKNLLDNFVKHYSYTDEVKLDTGNSKLETPRAPGGLSFTHDQGTHNQFSPFGHSAYELPNLTGCFSYMTQEQLCNWILIAASYVAKTNDRDWQERNRAVIQECIVSMTHRRDNRGIPARDSARCGSGREITTYDSLDSSLGQASFSSYLAVKYTFAFAGLACLAESAGFPFELADPIPAMLNTHRFIPALLPPENTNARALPTIEALIFPIYWKQCRAEMDVLTSQRYQSSVSALRSHTQTLLADPQRRNHFPDHGIRLSSTSDNSWLSKIALVQHVARSLFHLDENGNTLPATQTPHSPGIAIPGHAPRAKGWETADAAHVRWLTTGPGAYWCACDQIVNGSARGSKYYPRLITTALWLKE